MSTFNELFHRNYKVLKVFGVLLNERSSTLGGWFSYLRTVTSYSLHSFMVFQALYDLYLVHEVNLLPLNGCLAGLISGALIRNLFFLRVQPRVIEMHRKLWEDGHFIRDSETEQIFNQAIVQLKRITNFFAIVVGLALPSWLMMPFLNTEKQFQLIFSGWFPFETQKSPNFYFAYVMQLFYMTYIAVSIVCCDLMTFNTLLLIKTHYAVLARNIKRMDQFLASEGEDRNSNEINGDLNRVKMKNYVKDLVIHHHQILGFMNDVVQLLSPPLLLQFYGGSLMIACLVFEIFMFSDVIDVSSKMVAEFVLCTGTIGNLFTFCLFGTVLEHTSYSISEAVYDIKWYESKGSDSILKTFIILLISHSQRPHRLTAGKMTPVNFATFLSIMEMIYNTMALFRQIANKVNK